MRCRPTSSRSSARSAATWQTATRGDRRSHEIQSLVRELTGSDPQMAELISTEGGLVLFLTLNVGAGESLTDAHRLASELEEALRSRIDGITEVVVHTEP